jgi:hypothetical protein
MICQCFLDDSKDANQSKMLVCAGFVGERSDWISFRSGWSKQLKEAGIDYFKTSEYKMLTGQFEKFRQLPPPHGRNAARAIRDNLLSIIHSYENLRWVGVCVPMDEWNSVASRPEATGVLEHAYHRAIESIWVETVRRGFRRSRRHRHSCVAFVHDDGPDYPELSALYTAFRKLNPITAKYMVGFAGLDDKLTPPLQAADLVANHTLEIGMKWLDNGKTVKDQSELQSSMGFLAVWREDYAKAVLHHELKRKGLPIPADLEKDYSRYLP